jgi:tRNA U34 5-methylaminomethyl-2-thiouridine-forming methyltransferase MnmC
VYYDAFAPGTQPELWDEDAFRKMHQTLITGGALVSYCAQGAFKRNLKSAGFAVETLPGPPGKREMTRGIKL